MLETPAIRRGALLLAGVAIAMLYFWGLGSIGFLDPDEGMYAEIAREMLASGDWLIPRFNGVPYLEKPPLVYWLTAATYAVAGTSEFSARLWKIVPTLGTILLTYGIGLRLFGGDVGILSALLLATTLGWFLFGRLAQMDPFLVFAIALSVFGFVGAGSPTPATAGRSGWSAGLLFWIGLGIAVMSKGLPGLAFPLLLLVLWTLVRRDPGGVGHVWSWGGIGVALLLALPWHVAVAAKVPGFVQFYLLDNQVLRFLGERGYVEDGRSLGTLAFLGITVYALFPWAPYLGAALMALCTSISREGLGVRRQGMRSAKPVHTSHLTPHVSRLTFHASRFTPHDSRCQFLLGWIAVVIGAFTISSSRLEYYALPAFPAVAVLVAAFLTSAGDAEKRGSSPEHSPAAEPPFLYRMPLLLLRVWTWVALVGGLLYTAAVAWAWWAGYFTPQNIVRALSIWATNYRVMLEQGLPLPPVSSGYFSVLLFGGGLMWTGGFAAALFWLRRGQVMAVTLAVAIVGVGLSAMAASILRQIEPHHSLKPLAERLNGILQPEDVLVHERGLEKGGGLLFYTRRPVLVLNGTRGDLEFGSRLPGYRRAFIDTPTFQELWASGKRVFLVTDLPSSRSAISEVSDPTPILMTSTGTRWLYSNRMP